MELKNMVLRGNVEVIKDFTAADLDKHLDDCYFRFQCLDWAIRDYSCGMIYSNAKDAMEDGSTVLEGKSCVSNWRQLDQFKDSFDKDFVVMVFDGTYNGNGHDGEDVVTPEKLIAAYDYNRFLEVLETEIQRYKTNGWSLLDFTV